MNSANELVGAQLTQVEETLLNIPEMHPSNLRNAVKTIVASGGKRLRPQISLLVAGMFGKQDLRAAIDVASAVEMLHTATLVHDDLIDGSLVRRGAATLNAAWTPAATVLTGDFLFAFAAGLASRANSVRVMSIFSETLGVIVGGELRQQFTNWARRRTREDYTERIYAKTASMFVLAATAAGVVAEASEAQITSLNQYARNLGLAFQIMDDVLDFTGEQATVGKPVGSDLRRGLITLPTIFYIEANPDDPLLPCALEGNCSGETYAQLVKRIRESTAIKIAIAEAGTLANEAKRHLANFPDSPYRDALGAIADFTVARTT
ncbi:MAG: polyprenyl synthetase family protein [Chloroflexi bacterium]|jgi:geranylgeranyl pyrophosphate synthase|nr:polyprenyl synthetase family protein [Chloroflexota bacterium]